MPYHIFSIPCLRVIEDKNAGLTSIMDIVESATIDFGESKLFFPPFILYTKWGKDVPKSVTESFEVQIVMKKKDDAQGDSLNVDKFKITIPEGASGISVTVNLKRIEIPEAGWWLMCVNFRETPKGRWKEATKLPLFLKKTEKEERKTD